MRVYFLASFVSLLFISISCSALPWTQGYVKYSKNDFVHMSPNKFWNNGLNREPNCDELRAMWRFSVIKSRKTEISNEVPIYKDPFAHNLWEPHLRSKHLENVHLQGLDSQGVQNHVYGKVVHTVPNEKYADRYKDNGRSFEDISKFLMSDKAITPRRKNAEAFRLPNGVVSFRKLPALTDSFKRLKAVVRSEKAKEMHDQRLTGFSSSNGMQSNDGRTHANSAFEYLYFGNNSFAGKRNPAYKSLHFISNPSSFIHRPSKYYDQFLAEHYVTDYGYYYRPYFSPMRFSIKPLNSRSRY